MTGLHGINSSPAHTIPNWDVSKCLSKDASRSTVYF